MFCGEFLLLMLMELLMIIDLSIKLQIHWLAVNGRTELLHDLFMYVQDVDVEVSK
jgi:uncharacterized RDD family membrane protein YckC